MNATSTPVAAILSVNPAAKTVGAMHPEFADTLRRGTEVLARHTRDAIPMLRALFAADASRKTSAILLLARVLFGTMFIVMGLSTSALIPVTTDFAAPAWASPVEIIAGALLILGLFSRLSMLALVGLYGFLAYEAGMAGLFPQAAIMCALGALVNAAAGPGRYSIDLLLYKAFRGAPRRRNPLAARHSFAA